MSDATLRPAAPAGQPEGALVDQSAGGRTGGGTIVEERAAGHDPLLAAAGAGARAGRPSALGAVAALGVFLLLVFDLPTVSNGPFAPKAAVLLALGAAGLPLLVLRAVGGRWCRSNAEKWAARFAIAMVLAAVVATLGATTPALAVFGQYLQGTGLLFFVALAGCFGLGTAANAVDRRWIGDALVAGALVNAGVIIIQSFKDLTPDGISYYDGLVTGLMGNPVFSGAVLAAALAVVAARATREGASWMLVGGILALALGMSTERLPAIMALLVVAWVAIGAWRARNAQWVRATFLAGVTLAGLIAGSLLAPSQGVITHFQTATATETYGQRLAAWAMALHAIATRPWFGAGPNQFEAATLPHLTVWEARQTYGGFFIDSHDLVLELGVTIGLVGLAMAMAWLVPSFVTRRGVLVAVAAVILGTELLEPLMVAVTPIAALALGAAAIDPRWTTRRDHSGLANGGVPAATSASVRAAVDDALAGGARGAGVTTPRRRGRPARPGGAAWRPFGEAAADQNRWAERVGSPTPRWLVAVSLSLAALAAVPGAVLVVGDAAAARAAVEAATFRAAAARADGLTANKLLPFWPAGASSVAAVAATGSFIRQPTDPRSAVTYGRRAAALDPGDPDLWDDLANYQSGLGDVRGALATGLRSLEADPLYIRTLNLLGDENALLGDLKMAHRWWGRSLQVDGDQPLTALQFHGHCLPMAHHFLGMGCPYGDSAPTAPPGHRSPGHAHPHRG